MSATQSMISALVSVPNTVQNALDGIKEFTRWLMLTGMDIGIVFLYLLYVVLFFLAIKYFFIAVKAYKKSERQISKVFFVGFFTNKTGKEPDENQPLTVKTTTVKTYGNQ